MDLMSWFRETRPSFLLLTPIVFSVGVALSYVDGYFDPFAAAIGAVGVVLAHLSVNVFNEYFDYRSGLDARTDRTPFSGGSGMIVGGLVKPRSVFIFASGCLGATVLIGGYFAATKGLVILPIVGVAALTIYLYTDHLSHMMLGELLAGLNFGPLMVAGSYFTQTGVLSWEALYVGLVPGILVGNLLLLNEFPDVEADRSVGRRNSLIVFGAARSAKLYSALVASCYVLVVAGVAFGIMPLTSLLFLATLPIAVRAIRGALRDHGDMPAFIPAMGANVQLVLLGNALLAIGLAVSRFL